MDLKDVATLRFGHSDVVFDLLIETRFFTLKKQSEKKSNFFSSLFDRVL